jgi:hypothetical protein
LSIHIAGKQRRKANDYYLFHCFLFSIFTKINFSQKYCFFLTQQYPKSRSFYDESKKSPICGVFSFILCAEQSYNNQQQLGKRSI